MFSKTICISLCATMTIAIYGISIQADEIRDALRAAKTKRIAELAQAETTFLKAFDDAIVAAAKANDADLVQALVEQKDAFQKSGNPPTASEITSAFRAYVATRRSLAAELYRAYQKATTAYAEDLLTAEVKSLDAESKEFMSAEKKVLDSLSASEAKVSELKPTRTTADFAQQFIDAYDKEIEIARDQETKARFQQVMKELPGKMDSILKPTLWTLRCPITEISEEGARGGSYIIHFDLPDDFPAFGDGWHVRSSVTMKLKKDEALAVEPGQILVISASPRFSMSGGGDSVFLSKGFIAHFTGEFYRHEVHFTRIKMDIRRAAKE